MIQIKKMEKNGRPLTKPEEEVIARKIKSVLKGKKIDAEVVSA